MPDLLISMEAEDWVRRHVQDRGGDLNINRFDGGVNITVTIDGQIANATSYYGDQWSAWTMLADMMDDWFPEDDPSEEGAY